MNNAQAKARYVAALHELIRAHNAYYGEQYKEPWWSGSNEEAIERAADRELDYLEGSTPREREQAEEGGQ